MKKPRINKKIAIVSSVIVLGLIGGVSAEVANKPKAGADTSPLVTEVDQQNDKLNNHEARITNLEGDTKALQDKTGTTPTVHTNVPVVRSVTAPTSTAQPTPAADTPATVVSFREIVIDPDTSDCEYTYSDGTTYQFHWKSTVDQQVWTEPGGLGQGHYETQKSKITNGICSPSAIGTLKS